MHDLPAKNQWTGTRTIAAAANRTCIITLRLSDFKSETSLTLLLRHYELTNENFSYFLTNQSKTKTFVDLKVTRNPKPTKDSTRPYLNEIPAHFTHEVKTKGYDVIGINWFLRKLMRFLRILFMRSRQKVMTSATLIYSPPPHLNEILPQERGVTGAPYTTDARSVFSPFVA